MKRWLPSEQAVAEVVVEYLEAAGADIYQEVTVRGGVADIVARVLAETWIVEVKTSLSLALVAQAMERRRLAHRVYIAAPHTRTSGDVAMLCRELGIGFLEVTTPSEYDTWVKPRVTELAESKRWNRRPVELTASLKPEYKTHAKAGAIGAGGRWTPFRNTCEQVTRLVRENPGATIKEIVDGIEHHYSSDRVARSSLARWTQEGRVDGVLAKNEDGRIRLYPAVQK